MKCPNCGTESLEGELFCTVCGSRLEQSQQPAQSQPVQQPVQQPMQQPVQAAAQPTYDQQVAQQVQQPVQAAAQPTYDQQVAQQVQQPVQAAAQPTYDQQVAQQVQQPVYGQQPQQPMQQQVQQPMYGQLPKPVQVAEQPPKKKMKVWPIVLCVFLLLIASAGVAAYMNKEYVVNAWKKNFSSPKDYYLWVEKQNADKAAEKVANAYDEKMKLFNGSDQHIDFNVNLEMGKSLFEIMGIDEEDLAEYSFLQKMGMRSSADRNGESVAADLVISLAGQDLLTLNTIETPEHDLYFKIPELSPKSISMESEQYQSLLIRQKKSQELYESMAKCMPDRDTTERLYKRYMQVLYENYDKIDLNKSAVLRVSQLGQKCAQIDVTITREDLLKLSDAMITRLESDEEVKKIWEDYVQCIKNEIDNGELPSYYDTKFPTYDELMKDVREGFEKSKEQLDENDDFNICMSVYVDNKGKIIGREWKLSANGKDDNIRLLSAREKGQRAFEISALVDSNPVIFLGQGQETNGKLNGHFTLEVKGIQQFDVETKDFEVDALEEGRLNGTFILRPTDKLKALAADTEYADMIESATITMTSFMAANENRIYFDIDTKDEKFFGLSVEQFLSKANEIVAPIKEDIITVTDEDTLKEYVKTIDWTTLNQRLEAIGLPTDLLDELKEEEENLKEEANE